MKLLIPGPVLALSVSRKVDRWVAAASFPVQDAFDAAVDFAKVALPRAIAFLEPYESFLVLHFDTVLVVRFAPQLERFCIVAFYIDSHDPLPPPNGPGSRMRRRRLAEQMISTLGLPDGASRVAVLAPASPSASSVPSTAAVWFVAAESGCGRAPSYEQALLRSRDPRSSVTERDSPGSRSSLLGALSAITAPRVQLTGDRPDLFTLSFRCNQSLLPGTLVAAETE